MHKYKGEERIGIKECIICACLRCEQRMSRLQLIIKKIVFFWACCVFEDLVHEHEFVVVLDVVGCFGAKISDRSVVPLQCRLRVTL